MSSAAVVPMTAPTPLWTGFSKLASVVGFQANEFAWVPGKTPMATLVETVTGMILYYIVIFGGRELMRNRPAFQLKMPFMIHNFYLTAISGSLLVLFLEQLIPTLWNNGTYCTVCNKAAGWTQPLEVLYYLNYLTKYVEFIDTAFLVLKKKPLTFLHTYHHGATALLCYTQLVGQTSVSWVPITLNLSVHVIMYWYYFQSARGVKIWWKEYITILQIVQFIIDLGFVYFTSYNLLAARHFPSLPIYGACNGGERDEIAAWMGIAILTSYLFLFVAFYFATYKKAGAAKGKKDAAKKAQTGKVDLRSLAATKKESAMGALTKSVLVTKQD